MSDIDKSVGNSSGGSSVAPANRELGESTRPLPLPSKPPRELTEEEKTVKLAALDQDLKKFESQKRWSDVIRTIVAKAELVVDVPEKVELLSEAGRMYIERSANLAEAIKCFQRVLEYDQQNVEAITRLKDMYEKRRDWAHLVDLMRLECELLDPQDRAARYVEIADIATERLRKPEVCIELWQKVLESDSENAKAINALSILYERTREWEKLAAVLEKLSRQVTDPKEQSTLWQKLGSIYADKLNQDEGAIVAFKRLLELDPNDRRAQEQLKKRFVTTKAWDELERFYAASNNWDELIRVLERAVETPEMGAEERIAILFRVARMWQHKKEKPDRAARAYEKILSVDPQNLEAAEALTPIFEQMGDAKKLASVYEIRLKHVEEQSQRLVLLREAGLLYEEKLRNYQSAFDKFIEAFSLDPTQELPREDIERVAPRVNGWEGVFTAYSRAIDDTTNPTDLMGLRINFARVLVQTERVTEAISQYRAVYEDSPDHQAAITALDDLYRKTGNYRELLLILERRADLETDSQARKKLAYEMARIWHAELRDENRAIGAYQSILTEYGDEEKEAHLALDKLFEQQERWEDLAGAIEKRLDLVSESEEEQVALRFRLGRVVETKLEDKTRALALYREVLLIMPEHDGAREALEGLLEDKTLGGEAARVLEPLYGVRGEFQKLVKALEVLLGATDEKDQRLDLITRIGEVYSDQLKNPIAAFQSYTRALSEAPENPGILARLENIAIENGYLIDTVKLLDTLAEKTDDAELARGLWIRAAQLSDTQLEDMNGAVSAYMKALDRNSIDAEILGALEGIFRRNSRWRDLLDILRRRVETTLDSSEKEALLAQIAEILDEKLSEPDEAIRLYREILELNPASQTALNALDQLFERQKLWGELADNVRRQLTLAQGEDEQIALMLKLGNLHQVQMNAVEAAIEIYRDVLERDAFSKTARGALEALLKQPEYQLLVTEILEPLYRDGGEFEKLIGVHEIQVSHSNSPDQRIELLHRMSELYGTVLGDGNNSFKCLARALAEDPVSSETQDKLDRMAEINGLWGDLARVYEDQFKRLDDTSLAASLHMKVAAIREDHLSDHAGAIEHYRNVLTLDDTNLDAADALERLYQLSDRYEELAKIYLTKANMLGIPEEQKRYYFRAADIYEEILERPSDAVEVYIRSLEIDPDNVTALNKLIELYLKLEQWENLLGIYTHKAEIVDSPEEKKALFTEVGAVYERELKETDRAIASYQRILEIDPDDVGAISRLDALYQKTGNWQELLPVLEREADILDDPLEVISYRYRIGELWERRLGDPLRAVEIYREILATKPDHEPSLNALESMISEGREVVAAADVLEPVYQAAFDVPKLVAVLEVQIEHEEDSVRRVELLHRVAELYETQLDQLGKAFDAFARALPCDNTDELTLNALERLAEPLSQWNLVAQLYDAEIEKSRDRAPEAAVDLALRLAQIFEVHLGDVDAAISRYRIVHDTDASHVQAIESLDRLYEATSRWSELADIIQKEIEIAAGAEEITNLQFRLAQLYQLRLEEVGRAIDQYREILASTPEHDQSIAALEKLFAEEVQPVAIGEILEPLYRKQESWERLIRVQEVQLRFQPDPDERILTMHRIAEIAEEKAGDRATGFTWILRALLEDPSHDHSISESERLAELVDGWAILANSYAEILDGSHPKEVVLETGKRLGRVYEEKLGDVARAEEVYRFVLSVDDKDDDILIALDNIYSQHGSGASLVEILKKRIEASKSSQDKTELNLRLGEILFGNVGRVDEAIAIYRHILDNLDSQQEQAVHALQDIYTKSQDWKNLYDALEKELDIAAGDSTKSEILSRMASIAFEKLNAADQAIELWRRVLDLSGEDPQALNALGNIYAVQSNWADLVDVLEREAAVCEDDRGRLLIYSDLGRIWYDKLKRDRNALESWERVLDIDPGHTDALFAIANIHRASESYSDLIDTLHRVVEVGRASLEDKVLEDVFLQLGLLYSDKLGQVEESVTSYGQALEINSRSFASMDALEEIFSREGRWEEYIHIKECRAEAIDDVPQKIDVLLSIANAWKDRVGDKANEASGYRRIIDIFPKHDLAFSQLVSLYQETSRFVDLIDLYIVRFEAIDDLRERITLLRQVAEVQEAKLGDRAQAFDALLLAWTQDFSDDDTSKDLERIAGLTQRWNEVFATANNALQNVQPNDYATKIAICLKCARWYGREGHPEYAIPYLQQILAIDSSNLPAMRQMAELYRQTKQWQVYLQVLVRMVGMTEKPEERAEFYLQMGELNEEQLSETEQAIAHYLQALEAVPNHIEALDALERVYQSSSRWPELVDVLKKKIVAITEPGRTQKVKLQLADIYELRISDKDKAIDQYRQVLEEDAASPTALQGLERLYTEGKRWQELIKVLEAQLDVASTDKDRISLLMRIAGMWEEEFVKPDKAAERLEQIVDIDSSRVEALKGLERLYRQLQRWDNLIQTYRRHVDATPDREEKIAFYQNIAQIYRDELNNVEEAIDAFLNVTSLDDGNIEAIDSLTRLYEKRGDYNAALDAMDKLSRLVREPEKKVDIYYRIGSVYKDQARDQATAQAYFQKAVDIDSSHLAALLAMREIFLAESDWPAAARVLEQASKVESQPRRKAELKVELGKIYEQKLDERKKAIVCFEEAYQLDSDNEAAAFPLVDEYVKEERWNEVKSILQMLVKRSGDREQIEQHKLWFILGQSADHTEDSETAIKAYNQAFALDAQDLPSLMGLAAVYFRTREWEKSFKFYQMVLVHHREELSKDETTETLYRLGIIKLEQGERKKALNMFDKALEENASHRPTLEALVKLFADQQEFEQVIHFKKQILQIAGQNERFALEEEIGDLWLEQVKNQAKAIEAYQGASEIEPSNHRVLHKLLTLYQATGQWEQAVGTIEKISGLDDRQSAKAKYAYTIGVIQRDELKNPDKALEMFSYALDLDSSMLKSFESINKILTQKKDWKQLERAFRKMLHRISGKGDLGLEFNLWHNLGVIYRDRQHSFESAAEAFNMAAHLQPDNIQEHQILAEIYSSLPNRLEEAIKEHQTLIGFDPYRVDSYKALYKLYFDARAYDKAWCLSATLNFLNKADSEQKKFFDQYKPKGPIRPKSRLNNERWVKDLFHPDEDFLVGKVFEAITPAVLRIRGKPDKFWQLNRKQLIQDLNNTTVTFARTFGFVAQVLNLPFIPRLFVCPDRQGGLAFAATNPPATICGSTLLSGYSPTDLMFHVARHLNYYRGEHYIRTMFQTKDEMKLVILAAMKISGVDIKEASVNEWASQIQVNMEPADLELLSTVRKRFVDSGAKTDIKRWMQAIELTGCRAGLLMSNDLDIASRMIQSDPPGSAVDLTSKEKIKELVLFSVSEQYFRLREALGIQIEVA